MQPLNWLWTIDYGLFCFYIYIRGRFSLFFYEFSHWFHDFSVSCSTFSMSMKSMKPNGNISTESAKVLYFVWEQILFYTVKVKVFLLQQSFWKRFSNFRSNRLNSTTLCETSMLKMYFSSFLAFDSKPGFHNFRIFSTFYWYLVYSN